MSQLPMDDDEKQNDSGAPVPCAETVRGHADDYPLTLAVETGDAALLERFIKTWRREDIYEHAEKKRQLRQALCRAIELDDVEIVRMLLAENAQAYIVCNSDHSPMQTALRLDRREIVELLLQTVNERIDRKRGVSKDGDEEEKCSRFICCGW